MANYRTFSIARESITNRFRLYSEKVWTEKWQGNDISKRPDMVSYELLNETFTVPLFDSENLDHYRKDIKPNLPWADDHFAERVCGAPLNPGTQWRHWPWASSADKHRTDEMFNHTYAERLWPRYAGKIGSTETVQEAFSRTAKLFDNEPANRGIRGSYGDLSSLVHKLIREPHTRQAYIPLFFPEDTGLDDRMPCTLGYGFIMRNDRLHLYYPLRSCDFVRHWPDDCYLAIRLLLWVLDECRKQDTRWERVTPGTYTMHMTSLHVFANDAIAMGIKK